MKRINFIVFISFLFSLITSSCLAEDGENIEQVISSEEQKFDYSKCSYSYYSLGIGMIYVIPFVDAGIGYRKIYSKTGAVDFVLQVSTPPIENCITVSGKIISLGYLKDYQAGRSRAYLGMGTEVSYTIPSVFAIAPKIVIGREWNRKNYEALFLQAEVNCPVINTTRFWFFPFPIVQVVFGISY